MFGKIIIFLFSVISKDVFFIIGTNDEDFALLLAKYLPQCKKKKPLLKCLLIVEKQMREDHQKLTKYNDTLLLGTIKRLRNANISFTV